MPNIPQQETIVQYVANSSQTVYTFAFYAPLPTDIQVYYQASNAQPIPAADILDLNTDYTVTYNSDPITGGYITLLFTPTSGFYLTINRQVAASLNTNFNLAQNFNGANLDAALDRLLLLCQQNQNYALERNLSYIINTYLPNAVPYTQLPPLTQNQFWMGSGSGVIAATVAQVPSASVLQSALANNAPGTAGSLLVGYYNNFTNTPMTVSAALDSILNSNSIIPPGVMLDYAGDVLIPGWLVCDGSAVSRTTYANLFAKIGTLWGSGNGTTTFNLPNMGRRVCVGSGGTGTAELANTPGSLGGEESHTMTGNELVSHTHPAGAGNSFIESTSGGSTNSPTGGGSGWVGNANTGANTTTGVPFNVIQPSAVILKIIKY